MEIIKVENGVKQLVIIANTEEEKEMGANIDNANKKAENALKELEETKAKQTADTELLDNAGNWLSKLWNR